MKCLREVELNYPVFSAAIADRTLDSHFAKKSSISHLAGKILFSNSPWFWIGGFARYDTLRDAEFAPSPLVTSKRYVAGGIGISWIFAESKTRVAVPDLRGGRS